jgi:hypothetical protein
MITMIDEIYDRGYQAGRAELHAGIDRLGARIGNTFKAIGPGLAALNRLEWTAPWNEQPKRKA